MSMRHTSLAAAAAAGILAFAPARAGLPDSLGGLGGLFGSLKGSGGIIALLEALTRLLFPVDGHGCRCRRRWTAPCWPARSSRSGRRPAAT